MAYIPPNGENMAHEASELIQKKIEERQREFRIVIMGDFNHIVNPAIDKQPSTKICKKLRLHTWLRSQNFIDTYRYWNRESRKFTWSNGSTATRIDQIWVSEKLKNRVKKAEIEKIETITGSDYSLVLLQLRSGSSFSRMKECALERKQTTRLVWNLDMALKEN